MAVLWVNFARFACEIQVIGKNIKTRIYSILAVIFVLLFRPSAETADAASQDVLLKSARAEIKSGTRYAGKDNVNAGKERISAEISLGEVTFYYSGITAPGGGRPVLGGDIGVRFKAGYNWNINNFFHPFIKIKDWSKTQPLFGQPVAGVFVGEREDKTCFGDIVFDLLSETGEEKIFPKGAGLRILTFPGGDYFLFLLNIEPEASEFTISLTAYPYSTAASNPLRERWLCTEKSDERMLSAGKLITAEESLLLLYNRKDEVQEKGGCFFAFLPGEIKEIKAWDGVSIRLTVQPGTRQVHLLFGEFFGEHYSSVKERIFQNPSQYQKILMETDWGFPIESRKYEPIRKDLLSLTSELSLSEEEKNKFAELDKKTAALGRELKKAKTLHLSKEREYLLSFEETEKMREKLMGEWLKVLPVK